MTAPLDTAADRALAESLDGSQNTRLVRARFIATLDALDAATARAELYEEVLTRLGSMEALEVPGYIDPNNPLAKELVARIDYARDALSGREGV